jgi:hypothetical protein
LVGTCALVRERDRLAGPGSSAPFEAPEEQPDDQLQAVIDGTRKRIVAKRAVIQELLAGRLTIRQAAGQFQELDARKPSGQLTGWRANCPGDTEEERYCWTVLRFVAVEVRHAPEQVRAFRRRVEAELPADLRCRLLQSYRRLGLSGTDSADILLEQPIARPTLRVR